MRFLLKNRRLCWGFLMVSAVLLFSLFGPLAAGHSPFTTQVAGRLKAPSALHWFGTDTLGRDLFARLAYGGRVSLGLGFSVGIISTVLGIAAGLWAGLNRAADQVTMRLCDGIRAIPSLLLSIAMMSLLGAGIKNLILCLSLSSAPSMARLTRSAVLSAREQPYVEAAKSMGAGKGRILFRHIAPNIVSPLIVQMTFLFAQAVMSEAALSFLGAGIPAPLPSWGSILNEASTVIYSARWMLIFPGLAAAFTVLGLNLLGDGLRDALDPLRVQ
ncbi:MAG: ABC transporter permease [Treponema sp.]|nr:ABC transporter permease [Treponema sp.]